MKSWAAIHDISANRFAGLVLRHYLIKKPMLELYPELSAEIPEEATVKKVSGRSLPNWQKLRPGNPADVTP